MVRPLWSLVLFTRLDAAGLLENELRRGLVEEVRDRPGATLGELARALQVDYTTARHHARVLERAGKLVRVADGRARRLYLPGAPKRRAPPPQLARALEALGAGAATPTTLGRALGVPRGTAGSLLQALARAGLAQRRPEGWRLTPEAQALLPGPSREAPAA